MLTTIGMQLCDGVKEFQGIEKHNCIALAQKLRRER